MAEIKDVLEMATQNRLRIRVLQQDLDSANKQIKSLNKSVILLTSLLEDVDKKFDNLEIKFEELKKKQ